MRWAILRSDDTPLKINSIHRIGYAPRENLQILKTTNSNILQICNIMYKILCFMLMYCIVF